MPKTARRTPSHGGLYAARSARVRSDAPTPAQFGAYNGMFDYFNGRLFGGSLPSVLLNFSRLNRTYGFFAPERWAGQGKDRAHEISLNPQHLKTRKPEEVASTLVHEMVHLWQHERGEPSRSGYHNREWAEKMLEVGLIPSSTGQPGGKQTGQHMTHYIDPTGEFLRAWSSMPGELWLPWAGIPEGERRRPTVKRYRFAYECPKGHGKVWGRPGLALVCGECGRDYDGEALGGGDHTNDSAPERGPVFSNTKHRENR